MELMGTAIHNPLDIKCYTRVFDGKDHEELWVLYLNNANVPVKFQMISSGGWDSVTFDIRQILREALVNYASNIILMHNHPHGEPAPSSADVKNTDNFRKAADLLLLKLIDHIIVTERQFYTFSGETVYSR